MMPALRRRKIVILALLALVAAASFVVPPLALLFLAHSPSTKDFVGDGIGHLANVLPLNLVQQENDGGLKVPEGIVYKNEKFGDVTEENMAAQVLASDLRGAGEGQQGSVSRSNVKEGLSNQTNKDMSSFNSWPLTNVKILELEDQLIMAKTYLHFSPPTSNSHLVRELKLRIKEIERVLSHASRDSDLFRSDLQKMRAMEVTLSKAHRAYPDCSAVASKLRAQAYNAEEQLREQQNQASYLIQLAARTFPKGLHCLSMQLTTEFFSLPIEKQEFPTSHKVHDPDLYHIVIFSNNVLACAVVVNSTISRSKEAEKIVFHVVTDSLNFPAMMMWFLLNPPGQATIKIQSMDEFKSLLPTGFSSMFMQPGVIDPRYTSTLNYLRFYLPEIFPSLNKVLLLDHDVVVQRDLRALWSVDMKGKVNGAVQTCKGGKLSPKLKMLVNFSDPTIANMFDAEASVWAFGMNLFDLTEWRRQGLTRIYHEWHQLGKSRKLWKAGSLPLGQLIFYNHTVVLDSQWHALGLGRDSSVRRAEIERAAVIHYDGNMKPWLEIAIPKYKFYWNRFLDFNIPYLQQCNIHE